MRASLPLLALAVIAGAASGSSPASEAAAPRPGGSVAIAMEQEPPCLNVLAAACFGAGTLLAHTVDQVLEGAFEVGPDLTFRPNLVSHATVAKQPFTVTYHIRQRARWSDAVPVTARDFVFTFHAFLGRAPASDPLRAIRRVRALDAKTVRVVFRSPVPDWRTLFHTILPRHALAGEELEAIWQEVIDNPKTGQAIGSGPFLVQRFERGRQLTLARNPRYWGPHKAYLDRLVFRYIGADDYVAALRGGAVDVIEPVTAAGQAAALELRRRPARGVKTSSGPGVGWEHLEIRIGANGHPALKNRLVRLALAYGIDRQAIARTVLGRLYGERGGGVKRLDSVVFLTHSPFYRPNWNAYRYRPAEARRLLAEAGCRRGPQAIYACGGQRLSLRFVTTAGVETRELTLRLVQVQLRRVGIEVTNSFAPPRVFFGTVLPNGEFDVALFRFNPGPTLLLPRLVFSCRGMNNFTGYCNRLVTRDLVRSTRILDAEQRVRLLNKVDVRLAKDVPVIPLFQPPFLIAHRTTVRGIVPTDAEGFTWNSEDWWLER